MVKIIAKNYGLVLINSTSPHFRLFRAGTRLDVAYEKEAEIKGMEIQYINFYHAPFCFSL